MADERESVKMIKDLEDRIAVLELAAINGGQLVRDGKGRCCIPGDETVAPAKKAKE